MNLLRKNREVCLAVALFWTLFSAGTQSAPAPGSAKLDVRLPLKQGSTRFAVIGDSGTGGHEQYEIAQWMNAYQQAAKFDFVIMLGDNIYGGHDASDFDRKFARPYQPLLDRNIKFYASLGNHDDPNVERQYRPFNMNGQRYYDFKKGDITFFALDSTYMDPTQLSWLEQQLRETTTKWKIAYFHHPLFNDGRHHGPDLDLRAQLMPLFLKYGVNAVFSGHEHVYERLQPQQGIYFFVLGSSGKLMSNDFHHREGLVDEYDQDRTFMLVEIADNELYFQVVSRQGRTIDFGSYPRQLFAPPSTPKP